MSEHTKAGFVDQPTGFQVQFIEDVAQTANLEAVVQREEKLVGFTGTPDSANWAMVISGAAAANAEREMLPANADGDFLQIGNAEKFTLRVFHEASDGGCKITPIGYSVIGVDGDPFGYTPFPELTFVASAWKIKVSEIPDVFIYPSLPQEVDAKGFTRFYFVITEVTGTSNDVTAHAWPETVLPQPI